MPMCVAAGKAWTFLLPAAEAQGQELEAAANNVSARGAWVTAQYGLFFPPTHAEKRRKTNGPVPVKKSKKGVLGKKKTKRTKEKGK